MAHPMIVPNYLDNEEDMKTIDEVNRLCKRLIATKPLSDYAVGPIMPTEFTTKYEKDSDEMWREMWRHFGCTLYHPT